MPATSLSDLEQRLEACLLELEKTHLSHPSLPTALARAEAGQRIDDLLGEIFELPCNKVSAIHAVGGVSVARLWRLADTTFKLDSYGRLPV